MLALILLRLVLADLPVHCLRHQVVGDWTFFLSQPTPTRTSCGHHSPDIADKQPRPTLDDDSNQLDVSFAEPSIARASGDEGYFSMVYDEGFEFTVAGRTFFTFSGFDIDANGRNHSLCGETELGWYSNPDRTQFGCFYGRKKGGDTSINMLQIQTPPVKPSHEYVSALSLEQHEEKVAFINERATTWRAKAYDQYADMSIQQLNTRAGIRRAHQIHPTQSHPKKEQKVVRRLAFLSTTEKTRIKSVLPSEFDWRNVNGTSYIEPVMDQGDCGSCYVVSTVRMLSARYRIKTGDTVPWSISFPLYCSEYNQGCDGGYGTLVSRWSQDVGLVPATCAPYTTHGQCNYACDTGGSRWRADAHRYIGGYYGAANSMDMQLELMQNGPFTVGIEPKSDFMYYSDGIYQSGSLQHSSDGWERVDHAVLLVGWGEEGGVPYWVLQNSWDSYWGEGGYMRIKRGENDSGIESIPEAADVVQDDSSGQRVASFMDMS